jgi:hypothetical protein
MGMLKNPAHSHRLIYLKPLKTFNLRNNFAPVFVPEGGLIVCIS